MTKSLLFTLCFFFFISHLTSAQMSAGFSLGCINYSGDLAKGVFDPREVNVSYGIYVAKRYANPKFSLKGHLMTGAISGNDANYLERSNRGLKFKSPVTFVGTTVEYAPFAKKFFNADAEFVPQKNFFVSTGIGFTFFNPKVQGLDLKAPDKTAEISKTMVTIPINMGVRFDLVKDWSIAIEGSFYMPFTDYLDGISVAANASNSDKYIFYGFTLSKKWGDMKDVKVAKQVKGSKNVKSTKSTKSVKKKPKRG